MTLISVITVSFNQAQYLERCRRSILSQGVPVEHIVVDPGSTDGSRDMIDTWGSGVVKVFERDDGPADGLNNGLSRVTGGVWLYLNADDELAPGALRAITALHQKNPGADIIIGNGWTIDEHGSPIKYIRSDRFTPRRYCLGVGTVLQQATSFKSASTLGSLRFNAENRFNWDTELLFEAYRQGFTLLRTDDVLGYFRLQPASITMSGKYEKSLLEARQKLRSRVRGSALLNRMSYFARVAKRLTNTVRSEPEFPGLAS